MVDERISLARQFLKLTSSVLLKALRVTIHTARPGIVIGKKGEDIEKLRKKVSQIDWRSNSNQH